MIKKITLLLVLMISNLLFFNTQTLYAQPTLEYANGYGTTGTEQAKGVVRDNSNNIIQVGVYGTIAGLDLDGPGPGTALGASLGSNDVYVAKYNPDGKNLQWVTSFGSNGIETVNDVAVDAAGNIYVGGSYSNGANFPGQGTRTTGGGTQDFFVAKLNPTTGSVMTLITLGGTTGTDEVFGIDVDNTGNMYVLGTFNGGLVNFGSAVLTSSVVDVFLAKYDAAGTNLWVRQISSPNADLAFGLDVDNAQNVVITGAYQGTATVSGGGPSLVSNGAATDIFLIKYNNAGTYQWSKSFGGNTLADQGRAVITDAANDVYLTGTFFGAGVDFNAPAAPSVLRSAAGAADAFIAKYNGATGQNTWAQPLGSAGTEAGTALGIFNNELYVAGTFNGSADFDPSGTVVTVPNAGGNDIFLGKYATATGNYIWAGGMGGTGNEQLGGIHVSEKDQVIMTATTATIADFDPSPNVVNVPNAGGGDVVMASYGPPYYYSRQNGNWEDPITWSHLGYTGPSCGCTPGYDANVFIGNAFAVTKNTSALYSIDSLTIDFNSNLNMLNFGSTLTTNYFTSQGIGGNGKISFSNSSFINVTLVNQFSNTMGAQWGTIEYTGGSYTLPALGVFPNLVISGGGGVKTLNTGTVNTVNNHLVLNTGAQFSINSPAELNLKGNITNDGTLNSTSVFTFNNTTADQTISGAGATNFNQMVLDKSGFNVSLGMPIRANTSVGWITSGLLQLNGFDLIMAPAATFISPDATKFVATDGTGVIAKEATNISQFIQTFPLGFGTEYTPFQISSISATVVGTAILKMKSASNGVCTNCGNNNLTITSQNLTGSSIVSFYFQTTTNGSPNAVTRDATPIGAPNQNITLVSAGVHKFGPNGPAGIPIEGTWRLMSVSNVFFTRNGGGQWQNAATWSDVSFNGPVAATAPLPGSSVYIGDNDSVYFDGGTPAVNIDSLRIDKGSALDVGNSGNLLTITKRFRNDGIGGNGTLRLSSGAAPAVTGCDFCTIAGTGFGTFDYYGATYLMSPLTGFPNLKISGTGVKTLNSFFTAINGKLSITGANNTLNLGTTANGIGVLLSTDIAPTCILDFGTTSVKYFTNTGSLNCLGTISMLNGAHTLDLLSSPNVVTTFIPGTAKVIYSGAAQNMFGASYWDLEVSGGGLKTLMNQSDVGNSLLLNGAIIDLGANNLVFSTTATISGTYSATNHLRTSNNGAVILNVPPTPPFNRTIPVGSSTYYMPADINLSGYTSTGGSYRIRALDGEQPAAPSPTTSLNGYWYMFSANLTNISGSLNFTYEQPQVQGTEVEYVSGLYTGAWTMGTYADVDETLNKITFVKTNAADLSGDYTAMASQSITTSTTITPTTLCQGQTINVPFTIGGTFTAGNTFTAQISNDNFTTFGILGTLPGTAAGTIIGTVSGSQTPAGNYRIRVISSNPAVVGTDNTVNITVQPTPTAPTTANKTICQGSDINLIGTGSIGGTITQYSFWNAPSAGTQYTTLGNYIYTNPTLSNTALTAGTYNFYVQATNSAGCISASRKVVTVTVDPALTVSAGNDTSVCLGNPANFTPVTTGSPTTFNWTFGDAATSTLMNTSHTYGVAGNYTATITISKAGCPDASDSKLVTVNPTPAVPTVISPVTYCQGSLSSPLTAGGTALLWYTASTGGTGSGVPPVPSTAATGTTSHYVSQTVSGCESPRELIDVIVSPPLTAGAGVDIPICDGSTASLSGTSSGTPLTATWSGGIGSFSPNANTFFPTYNPDPTETGTTVTLTLTVSKPGCSDASDVVDIIISPIPATPTFTSINPTCGGITDGVITIDSPIAGEEYSVDGFSFQPSSTFTGLPAGAYLVSARNASNTSCASSSNPATLTIPPAPPSPSIDFTTQPTCGAPFGTIVLFTNTGEEYSSDGITYQPGGSFTPLAPNTNYTLFTRLASDQTCISASTNQFIQPTPPPPTATLSAPSVAVLCPVGGASTDFTVTLTSGTGPFSFTLTNGTDNFPFAGQTSPATVTVFPTVDGVFQIINLVDANSCAEAGPIGSQSVTFSPEPIVTLSAPSSANICTGGSTNFTVTLTTGTAPFNFVLTNGSENFSFTNQTSPTTVPVSPTVTGTFQVIAVTDGSGCLSTPSTFGSQLVTVVPTPTATLSAPTDASICLGGTTDFTITLSTGTSPINFSLSNGIDVFPFIGYFSPATVNVAPTISGNFEIINLVDALGCTPTGPFGSEMVTVNAAPVATLSTPTMASVCPGGTTDFTVTLTTGSGTMNFMLSNGTDNFPFISTPSPATVTVSPTITGNFEIINLVDASGCSPAGPFGSELVTVNATPVATLSAPTIASVCPGGTTDFTVTLTTGSGSMNFELSNGTDNFPFISMLSPATITVSPTTTGNFQIINLVDAGGCTPAGPFGSELVSVSTAPIATLSTPSASAICASGTTDFTVTLSSGTDPFDFTLTNGTDNFPFTGQTSPATVTVSPTLTGTWQIVSLVDAAACTPAGPFGSELVTVNLPPTVSLSAPSASTICETNNVNFVVTLTSGTDPFSYTLTNGTDNFIFTNHISPSSQFIIPTVSGTFQVINVTDASTCPPQGPFGSEALAVSPAPVVNLSTPSDANLCQGESTNFTVTLSSGTGPFDFTLNNGTDNFTFTNQTSPATVPITPTTTATFQLFNINDAGSCPPVAGPVGSEIVIVNPLPVATLSAPTVSNICPSGTTDFIVTLTTGAGPMDFTLTNGTDNFPFTGQTSPATVTVSPTITGSWQIINLTDAAACTPAGPFGSELVTISTAPIATLSTPSAATICPAGTTDFIVTLTTGAGPMDFTLTNGTDNFPFTGQTSPATVTVSPTITGSWQIVSLVDAAACTPAGPFGSELVTISTAPVATLSTPSAATICPAGTTDFIVTLTTGAGPMDFTLTNGTDNFPFTGQTSPATVTVSPTITGSWQIVSLVDAAACTPAGPFGSELVTISTAPIATLSTPSVATICPAGTTDFTVTLTTGTDPFDFTLTNGTDNFPFTGQTSPATVTVSPTITGSWQIVSLVDAAACTPAGPFGSELVTISTAPVASLSTPSAATICTAGTTDFTVTLTTGTDPFDFTLTNGTDNFPFTGQTSPATVTVSPTITGSWQIVSLVDAAACTPAGPFGSELVTISTAPVASLSTPSAATICTAGTTDFTVTLTTGTDPFDFTLTNGTDNFPFTGQTSPATVTVSPTITGSWQIVSLVDAAACTPAGPFGSELVTISTAPIATLSTPSVATICPAGTTDFTVTLTTGTDPFDFTLTNGTDNFPFTGQTSPATVTVSPTITGSWQIVSLVDAAACTPAGPFGSELVTISTAPVASLSTPSTATICPAGTTDFTVTLTTGTDPFDFTLTNGTDNFPFTGQTSPATVTVSPTITGSWQIVSLVDAAACTPAGPFGSELVTISTAPVATLSTPSAATICTAGTTDFTVTLTTGTDPFDFTLTNGTDNFPFTGQTSPATVTVSPTITGSWQIVSLVDAAACTPAGPFGSELVTISTAPIATLSTPSVATICPAGTTDFTVTLTTGTDPFDFTLTNGTDNFPFTGQTSPATVTVSPTITGSWQIVSLVDAAACTPAGPFGSELVTISTAPIATLSTPSAATICTAGTTDFTVTLTTGTDPFDFTLTNGTDNFPFTGQTSPATVTVSPTITGSWQIVSLVDAAACTPAGPFGSELVTIATAPIASLSTPSAATICPAGTTDFIVTLTTGAGPMDFTLTNGTDNFPFTGQTSPATVTVSPTITGSWQIINLTDAAACTPAGPFGSELVTMATAPIATLSTPSVATICPAGTTDFTVTLTTGTDPFDFTLTNGTDNFPFTGQTSPATVTVSPTITGSWQIVSLVDAAACTPAGPFGSELVTISTAPVATLSTPSAATICTAGTTDFTVTLTTGTDPFDFTLTNGTDNFPFTGQTSPATVTVSPTITGSWQIVSLVDAAACTPAGPFGSELVTISTAPIATLSTPSVATICPAGTTDFTVTLTTGTDPFDFTLTNGTDNFPFTGQTSPATVTVSPTITGSWQIVSLVDAAACTPAGPFGSELVTISTAPVATLSTPSVATICPAGTTDFTVTLTTGTDPFDFTLTNGTDNFPFTGQTSPATVTVSPTITGSWQIVSLVDAAACTPAGPFGSELVTISTAPVATLSTPSAATICPAGTTDFIVTLTTGAGPMDFTLTNGTDNFPFTGQTSPATVTVSPTITGSWQIINLTDAAACTPAGPFGSELVTMATTPIATLSTPSVATICPAGTTDFTVTLTTGTDPFDFTLTNGTDNFPFTGQTSPATVTVSPTITGSWQIVSLVDAAACTPAGPFGSELVTISTAPVATLSTPSAATICPAGTTDFTVTLTTGTDPFDFTLTNGTDNFPFTGQTSPATVTVSPTITGSWQIVSLVDAAACTPTGPFGSELVTMSAGIIATLTITPDKDTLCMGENATVTIQTTENGVTYSAFNNITTAVGTPVIGDGTNKSITITFAELNVGINGISIQANISGCPTTTLVETDTIYKSGITAPTIISNLPSLCNTNPIVFSVPNTFSLYKWYLADLPAFASASQLINGGTSSEIIYQPGYYFVQVYDVYGCSTTTTPLHIDYGITPTSPTQNNQTASSVELSYGISSTFYQWYVENASGALKYIQGANSANFKAYFDGTYYVSIKSNNCYLYSLAGVVSGMAGGNVLKQGFFEDDSSIVIPEMNFSETIEVHPNPSHGIFEVKYLSISHEPCTIILYNNVGTMLDRKEISEQGFITLPFDKTELTSGMYMIEKIQEGKVTRQRIMIQK